MSVSETLQIIIRARREGVTLIGRADGKLGWRANLRPSDELLAALKEHKADILALLVPPARASLPPPCASIAVDRAKRTIAQLRAFGFRPRLDDSSALLIVDAYAVGRKRRAVSERLPIGEVFDTLNAGLDADPTLLINGR
jgi:hypothetical protein